MHTIDPFKDMMVTFKLFPLIPYYYIIVLKFSPLIKNFALLALYLLYSMKTGKTSTRSNSDHVKQ